MVDVAPLELIMSEMKSDEVSVKVQAMSRLRIVASSMGPANTVSQLIPFVTGQTMQEDEVGFAYMRLCFSSGYNIHLLFVVFFHGDVTCPLRWR